MNRLLLAVAIAAILLLVLSLVVGLVPPAGALRANVIEAVMGETPEAKIEAYVNAVASGDESAALAAWELPDWDLRDELSARLDGRRQSVTGELVAAGLERGYVILAVQWWRTCCEPAVITDPRAAGGARVDVQMNSRKGQILNYRFDVFSRGGAYWGAAMSYPPRAWSLRDVYPADQEPLFWRWGY